VAKDGSRRTVMINASSISVREKGLHLVTLYDVTERVKLEQSLRESEASLQLAQQELLAAHHLAHIGAWSWDVITDTHEWSEEMYSIYGLPLADGPTRYPEVRRYYTAESWQLLAEQIETCLKHGDSYTCDVELIRPDGNRRWVSIFGEALCGNDGKVVKLRATLQDITERKALEDQVRQMAFYDPLTKLANRRLLNDRLAQAMMASKRTGCFGAVLFMDLDNFKPINDEHGHDAGDQLLCEAADRIKGCVRELDTVARFGGDEFVVMLGELTADRQESSDQARLVAEKILAALSLPYRRLPTKGGQDSAPWEHRCTVSIGIVLFVDHEHAQDDILKWADDAMYQAKSAGRNQARFYQREERRADST
jgi:diguanylate cyclase (GGDEF)-like protein